MQDTGGNNSPSDQKNTTTDSFSSDSAAMPPMGETGPTVATQINEVNPSNSNTTGNRSLSYFKNSLVPIIGVFVALIGIAVGSLLVTQKTGQQLEKSIASTPPTSPHLTEMASRGTIRIGTDATYPPMEYLDKNNNLVGYDIDLGEKIAEKLNLKAEFVNISWDGLFSALDEGKVDMVLSSITITEDRKIKYDFSEPYLDAGQVIITGNSNTTITTTADLLNLKVGVQKMTTNETEALKYTANEMVIRFDSFLEATNALKDGTVDAIITDLPNAKDTVNNNPELKIASEPFTQELYGIEFRKDDQAVVSTVNTALETLRQQGVLDFLKSKWLE